MAKIICVVLALCIGMSVALKPVQTKLVEPIDVLMPVITKLTSGISMEPTNVSSLTLSSFSYKDCGAAANAGHVSALSITPDPIVIPGTLDLVLQASLGAQEAGPIKLTLKMQKKIGIWVTIPCIDNVGSCTYPDVCVLLEKIPLDPSGQCPAPLPKYNVPCRCPLPKASWDVPQTAINIPKIPPSIPAALVSGDFQIHAEAYTSTGAQLLCLDVEFTLKDNS